MASQLYWYLCRPVYLYVLAVTVSIHVLRAVFCLFLPDRYHLKDVIVGKIYFLLVRIKIKHMEIQIIKRETTGTGNGREFGIMWEGVGYGEKPQTQVKGECGIWVRKHMGV